MLMSTLSWPTPPFSPVCRAHRAGELLSDRETREVCGICQQVFPDFRCWSHHAFKCHGRLREARCYAAGSQCGACLKHFASNFKLCDHLEHNQVCQATLVTRGALAEVQPGRGSKKFRAGDDVMCPALVADGPTHAPSVSVYFLTESALRREFFLPSKTSLPTQMGVAACKSCWDLPKPSFAGISCRGPG